MTTAEEIIAARKADPGKAPAAIAAELGVSRQRVSKVLTQAGISSEFLRGQRQTRTRPDKATPFAQRSKVGQVQELLGMSNNQVARMLGVTEVTVSRYVTGAIEPPKAVELLLLALLGGSPLSILAAVDAGERKLEKAVDAAKAEA